MWARAIAVSLVLASLWGVDAGFLHAWEKPSNHATPEILPHFQEKKQTPPENKSPLDQYGDPLPPGAIARFKHKSESRQVTFSPDAKYLITGCSDSVVVLEAATGRLDCQIAARGSHFALSTDGKTLAAKVSSASNAISLWDVGQADKLSRVLPAHMFNYDLLALSPDGKWLALGRRRDWIELWDTSKGTLLHKLKGRKLRPGERDPLAETGSPLAEAGYQSLSFMGGLLFSPDGRTLIGGGRGRQVDFWEVSSGAHLRHLPLLVDVSFDLSLSLSADGTALATSGGLVYAVPSGKKLFHAPKGDYHVALSPDGNFLAAEERRTGTVYLWEITTSEEICRLKAPAGYGIRSLAFAPRGGLLASVGSSNTVLVWDPLSLPELRVAVPAQGFGPKTIEKLWSQLDEKSGAGGYRTVHSLVFSPKESLPLLKSRLTPAPIPNLVRIRSLIRELDDNLFKVRENAAKELKKLGLQAEPELQQARQINKNNLELAKRIEGILAWLKEQPPPPGWLRELRCVQVLERIQDPEARLLLEKLAGGGSWSPQTQAAQAALHRLAKQTPPSNLRDKRRIR